MLEEVSCGGWSGGFAGKYRPEEWPMRTTWKPHTKHGVLTTRGDLPDTVFAFPQHRKEPLTDASHVRNALARFDQVTDVSDADRDLAFANIKKAADHYDVEMLETDWRELGKTPHTENPAQANLPIDGYAALTVAEIEEELDDLTDAQLRRLAEYERSHKHRKGVLDAIDSKLGAGSAT
jgi:hypothetical protein